MKLRIKDRRKFNRFIILSTLLVVLFTLFFTSVTNLDFVDAKDNHSYSIIVKNGDSLWSIAENLGANLDTRQVIYDIQKLNDLSSARINAGDKLFIPQY